MAKALFADIFGTYLENDLIEVTKNVYIEKCNLDIENRILNIIAFSEDYVSRENQLNIQNKLKEILRLKESSFEFTFSISAFCVQACADAVTELRVKSTALNGYFAGAEYNLNNDVVTISLKHGGYKKICELEFEKGFTRIIKNRFNKDITVEFNGQLDDVEIELPPPEAPTPRAEKKVEAKKQFQFFLK